MKSRRKRIHNEFLLSASSASPPSTINVEEPSFEMKKGALRGITLIEVLVVIGIIGVLAAILIPTVGRSKQRALSAKCMNNLRQVYLIAVNYADDNEGYFPSEIMLREKHKKLLFCPSDSTRPLNSFEYYISYSMRGVWAGITQLKSIKPTRILIEENYPWHDPHAVYPERLASPTDVSGKYNRLQGDGRVVSAQLR